MDNFIKRSEYSLCCFLEHILTDIFDINALRGISDKFKEVPITELFLKSWDLKIFLKYFSDNKIKNDFIVLQINLILMLIYPENETYFKQAKHLMLRNYNNSIKENSKGFWQYHRRLETYCQMMIHKGKRKYGLDLFEIQKYHLKIILNSNNKILSIDYLNLIRSGLIENELEWVEEFIKDNTKYLEEKDKENTYNCAKTLLEFDKQNYEESLSYASKLSIRTSYYHKLDVNILIIKCYLELSLYDAAFSLIDSSKHYLAKTDELNFDFKEVYNGILSIIYKLFKFKITPDNNVKDDLSNLKSEIINNRGIIYTQKWYLQKVEELEKSIPVKSLQKKLNKKSQSKKNLKYA